MYKRARCERREMLVAIDTVHYWTLCTCAFVTKHSTKETIPTYLIWLAILMIISVGYSVEENIENFIDFLRLLYAIYTHFTRYLWWLSILKMYEYYDINILLTNISRVFIALCDFEEKRMRSTRDMCQSQELGIFIYIDIRSRTNI